MEQRMEQRLRERLVESAQRHALINAHRYGKARVDAVIAKVVGENPWAKDALPQLRLIVAQAVDKVNAMSGEELRAQFEAIALPRPAKAEGTKALELPRAEFGKVVTRFAPEPNGYLHLGHAKAAWLSAEAAKKYNGSFFLRFDDTNPLVERLEYVEAIRRDLSWLGLSWQRESCASDSIEILYQYLRKGISQGVVYACTCSKEAIAKARARRRECACRQRSSGESLELAEAAIRGELRAGDALLRLKGDMSSLNTVMRDPTLARIVEHPHWRHGQRYKLWPTYDYAITICDYLDGVTHVLRSKEYELRDELYYALCDALGLPRPVIYDFSRLEVRGYPLSKRLLKQFIATARVSGWDDPRLLTIAGLRRRGVQPEAIKAFVLSFGLSKVDSTPVIDALLAENRRVLEPRAKRYLFVASPTRLRVRGAPRLRISFRWHPTIDLGGRELETSDELWIAKSDALALRAGELVRLLEAFNARIEAVGKVVEARYEGEQPMPERRIHWLPTTANLIKARVLEPHALLRDHEWNPRSLTESTGLIEPLGAQIEEDEIVQFLRYGFVRLDSKAEGEMRFIRAC